MRAANMQLSVVVAVAVLVAAAGSAKPPVAVTISSLKCEHYSSEVAEGECAVQKGGSQVIGKTRTRPREFPHMAHIGFAGADGEVVYQCGGSLVAPNAVLTAAHCVSGRQVADWVLLGELDHSTTADDARPERIAIKQRVVHPQFRAPLVYNDIAVLILDRAANLSSYVRPACLDGGADVPERAVATGWGVTDFAGEPSDHLMKVSLPIVGHAACAEAYSERGRRFPDGILDGSQICAGGQPGKGDTCQGDAGGPLQVLHRDLPCAYSVVGVTSFGKACDLGSPGVYTRVKHFVPWIEKIVWP